MAVNKVIYGNETLIDITDTTATDSTVLEGTVFYNAAGVRTVGSALAGISDVRTKDGLSVVNNNIATLPDTYVICDFGALGPLSLEQLTPLRAISANEESALEAAITKGQLCLGKAVFIINDPSLDDVGYVAWQAPMQQLSNGIWGFYSYGSQDMANPNIYFIGLIIMPFEDNGVSAGLYLYSYAERNIKPGEIPTNLSQLVNDSNFATESYVSSQLSNYVPTYRKVNGKALNADVTLTASDVSALPANVQYVSSVNGANGQVTLSYSDVGAMSAGTSVVKDVISGALSSEEYLSFVDENGIAHIPPSTYTVGLSTIGSSDDRKPLDSLFYGARITSQQLEGVYGAIEQGQDIALEGRLYLNDPQAGSTTPIVYHLGFTGKFNNIFTFGGLGNSSDLFRLDSYIIQCMIADLDNEDQFSTCYICRRIRNASDIPSTYSDVGAASASHTHTAADVGAVPTSRTVNGKALSSNITLTAADVGALSTFTESDPTVPSWAKAASKPTYTYTEVGAASAAHTHTYNQVGAASANHTHTYSQVGAASAEHTHTYSDVGALSASTTYVSSVNGATGSVYLPGQFIINAEAENRVEHIDEIRYIDDGVTGFQISVSSAAIGLQGTYWLYDSRGISTILTGAEQQITGQIENIASAIPTMVSQLENDVGYISSYTEIDPTVPTWAKASSKPTYTYSEVGAASAGHTHSDYATQSYVDSAVASISIPTEIFWVNVTAASPYTADQTYSAISDAIDNGQMVYVNQGGCIFALSDDDRTTGTGSISFEYIAYAESTGGIKWLSFRKLTIASDDTVSRISSMKNWVVNFPSALGTKGQIITANAAGNMQWSNMPAIPSTISQLTNDAGYLTLADLPIYDGSVS